ncbi:MAG: thioredoxin domain-containing protein [Ktedonobacteraceae bacterium]|nr:thioredoxin domain-containing protein [Ktedonobacteraceae bacterium]
MGNPLRISRFFVLFLLTVGLGCRAQSAPPAGATEAKLDRQIKLTIRSQYNVPPDYTVTLGQRTKSDINGYDSLPITFTNGKGSQKTTYFLISKDNNTLARLEKFDLTRNPAADVSILGRPLRGNPKAKVTLVSFDDLECPFCANMHRVLFPATLQHYGDLVRYVYRDFPLPNHPWAMHAAVDVNCLAEQSQVGYWNLVDYIHSHGSEISGENGQQNITAVFPKLDNATRDEGKRQKVNMDKLNSCIAKQDDSAIRSSVKQAEPLGVDGTPTIFINGERVTGALSQEMLWSIIDRALTDEGQVPPPLTAAEKQSMQEQNAAQSGR